MVILALSCFASPVSADHPDDVYWEGDFHYPGLVGSSVNAMVIYDGLLVAAGSFDEVDGTPVANIAAWNGSSWTPLATSMTHSTYSFSYIETMIVFDGKLIIGGRFESVDGIAAYGVAQWDGANWSPVGSGLYGRVSAFTIHSGQLVAGGLFSTTPSGSNVNVASWSGSSWSAVGGGVSNDILALSVYNGQLIAGGLFGGTFTGGIGYWTGSYWSDLGSLDRYVHNIVVFDGNLYVEGGSYGSGGPPDEVYMANWDGSVWTLVADGSNGGRSALFVHGDRIVTSCDVPGYGWCLAAWNGGDWEYVGPHPNERIRAFAEYAGLLYAGGHFTIAGSIGTRRVATWDGNQWDKLGTATGVNAAVQDLTVFGEDLIVAGEFISAGEEEDANYIAAWNDIAWSPLGTGTNGTVTNMIVYNDELIVSGGFTEAGGNEARQIAAWDGSTWSSLGSGVNGWIHDMTPYDGQLIVAGEFDTAGGVESPAIAAWDGASWSAIEFPVMNGLGVVGRVYSVCEYNDQLLAIGGYPGVWIGEWPDITFLPGQTGLYGSNDTGWAVIWSQEEGSADPDYEMTVYNGHLYLAGNIDTIGGIAANNIACWDGAVWSPLGGGVNWLVTHLTLFDGQLVVGGYFDSADGISVNGIAEWTGDSWNELGSGVSGYVYSMAEYRGKLFVGGSFTDAGDKSTENLAAWNPYGITCCTGMRGNIDFDSSDLIDIADLVYLVDFMFSGGTAPLCEFEANVDGLGELDISDLVYIVDYMFTSGPPPAACP